MLSEMTATQLREWMIYAEQEPFGYEFFNFMLGKICSVLAELQRDPKKRTQGYKPSQFMHRPLTPEEKAKGVIGDIFTLKD